MGDILIVCWWAMTEICTEQEGVAVSPYAGIVFQLVPSGSGWTENVLYSFTGTTDGSQPAGLVQDPSGNLYGFSICDNWDEDYCGYYNDYYGLIFSLQPSGSGWIFNVIYSNWSDCDGYKNLFNALTVDAAGGLYAAEGGDDAYCQFGGNCYTLHCGKIIAVGSHTPLVAGDANIFWNITFKTEPVPWHLSGAADGMAVDEDGCLWIALGARASVGRFTPAGDLDTEIRVDAELVASLCFAGHDRRDLYITTTGNAADPAARGGVFLTRSPVAGLAVPAVTD